MSFVFVTCSSNGPDSENNPPAAPAIVAPPNGASGITTTPTLRWACSDPDGDAVVYDVHIGTDSTPPAVSIDQSEFTYLGDTLDFSVKYYWKIIAKDDRGESTNSETWSFTTRIKPAEVVSTPVRPSGVSSGQTDQVLSYVTGGAVSSYGHDVEYQFAWGDGSYSDWSASTVASHSWSEVGTYNIIAQARCVTHTDIVSNFSPPKTIEIAEFAEFVSSPTSVSGPGVGPANTNLTFSTTGASSNYGHDLEYRFDWDDGSYSDWSASTSASHSWTEVGIHFVRAQARCATHTDVVSGWSPTLELVVY